MSVLAKVESRFMRSLSTSYYNEVHILIDGPNGGSIDTKSYTRIAMMASGAGISAQLPYVKELLEFQQSAKGTGKKGEHDTRKQRISLIWQLDEEYWICDWMDKLLDEDLNTLAIHYSLYILNQSDKDREDGQKLKIGWRGGEYYEKPDLKGILEKELQAVSGKLLVTVLADSQTQDELRSLVLSSSERVEFHKLDFQPSEKYGGFWAPKKQITHIGVA